jgi:hypothetical protein
MNKLPNFLIIGAAKSGTTALYHYLGQHPDVFLTPIKETNFFAQKGKDLDFKGPNDNLVTHKKTITEIVDYKNQFINVTDEKAIGEICPSYLYFEDAPKNIKEHIPEVKIIVILREPVSRAFSAWVHLTRDGREYLSFNNALADESRRIKDNWSEIWHYKEEGKYYGQLKRYYDSFPKDNIKVIIYEDFKKNPLRVYKEICDFIGVKSSFTPNMNVKHNTGSLSNSRFLTHLVMKKNIFKTLFRIISPPFLRKKIEQLLFRSNLISTPVLSKENENRLKLLFSEDVGKLEELIDIELNDWKKSN